MRSRLETIRLNLERIVQHFYTMLRPLDKMQRPFNDMLLHLGTMQSFLGNMLRHFCIILRPLE